MPDLFSPYTLKSVTLRNRTVISPMTMYNSVDGKLDDYHVSYFGARAAGGFALVFDEQMAIIERMGAVPAIQLGHTGRKGSELPPHRGTNSEVFADDAAWLG
jgi:2,4-dienoyl-CoA reductase-like NADH-dependent reductase (Old Yellow Enzyme family)